jgi:hypothetical protein
MAEFERGESACAVPTEPSFPTVLGKPLEDRGSWVRSRVRVLQPKNHFSASNPNDSGEGSPLREIFYLMSATLPRDRACHSNDETAGSDYASPQRASGTSTHQPERLLPARELQSVARGTLST